MRFEHLLHLAGLPRKSLGVPPASGSCAGKASKTAGASRADRSTDFQPRQVPALPDSCPPGAMDARVRHREFGIRGARVSAPIRLLAALGLMAALLAASVLLALPLQAQTQEEQPTPDAPRKPDGTAVFIGGVDLEWDDVPGADTYEVQTWRGGQWTDLPGDDVEIAFYGVGAIVSGLDPQSSLWFQVRAVNAHGVSEWSPMLFMNATSEFTLGRRARPANVTATGAPVIMGAAEVGETLRADTTGIEDDNGLDGVRFEYQWTSNDGSGDTDIAGATQPTYVWSDDEEGGTVSVRVSFVDRLGYAESLSSAAVGAVLAQQQTANNPATGQPTISGTVQVGETLTADTSAISDVDGLSSPLYRYQWLADGADIAGATATTYTLVDADEGAAVKVRVTFTDDASNEESLTSAATDAVEARPNSPATGAPEISGTAQVGETLTADTSAISDADGLSSAVYQYQWLADDADIAGATAGTYTLVDADEGAAVKVRVSFTDDAGNQESLTSAATDTVDFAVQQQTANTPATGQPSISGTAQVGETLTADTSGIADHDGLSNVAYDYQWLADDADITGATAETYTLVDTDESAAIKVRVSFTDDAGNQETLTSAATAEVMQGVLSESDELIEPCEPPPSLELSPLDELLGPPHSPTGLSAVRHKGRVQLNWERPDGITEQRIWRGSPGIDDCISLLPRYVSPYKRQWVDTNVIEGVPYGYRLQALRNGAVSEWSEWVLAVERSRIPQEQIDQGIGLVSNGGQAVDDYAVPAGGMVAQAFRTGGSATEYALTKVGIALSNVPPGQTIDVSIHKASIAIPAPDVLHDMVGLASPEAHRLNLFVPLLPAVSDEDAYVSLDPNSHYFVVVEYGMEADIGATLSDAMDAGAADDNWQVGTASLRRQENGRWTSDTRALRISIDGIIIRRPSAPTGLDATATHNTVWLDWDEPDDEGITGYRVERATGFADGFTVIVPNTLSAETSFVDGGLASETDYRYRITPIDGHVVGFPATVDVTTAKPLRSEPGTEDGVAVVDLPDDEPGGATSLGDVTSFFEVHSVNGAVNNGNDKVDYYSFSLSGSRRVNLGLTSDDTDANLFLEGNNLVLLGSSVRTGLQEDSISVDLSAGTYFVRVQSNAPYVAGALSTTYTLTYWSSDASTTPGHGDDYPATPNTTGLVGVGESATGNIDFKGDRDWHLVSLTAGQTYRVDTRANGTGHGSLSDADLGGIYSSLGVPIALTSNQAGARTYFTPVTTGDYYIEVMSNSHVGAWPDEYQDTGAYTVAVSAFPDVEDDDFTNFTDTEGVIDVGSPVTGAIDKIGDHDWFAMELESGPGHFYELRTSDHFYSFLRGVYDATGLGLEATGLERRQTPFSLPFAVDEAGTHFASVAAQALGDYTLRLDQYTARQSPVVMTEPACVAQSIGARFELDEVQVDLTAGTTYRVSLSAQIIGIYYIWGVYGPDDRLIQGSRFLTRRHSQSDPRHIVFTASDSGRHRLFVSGGGSTSWYELCVDDLATPEPPEFIDLGPRPLPNPLTSNHERERATELGEISRVVNPTDALPGYRMSTKGSYRYFKFFMQKARKVHLAYPIFETETQLRLESLYGETLEIGEPSDAGDFMSLTLPAGNYYVRATLLEDRKNEIFGRLVHYTTAPNEDLLPAIDLYGAAANNLRDIGDVAVLGPPIRRTFIRYVNSQWHYYRFTLSSPQNLTVSFDLRGNDPLQHDLNKMYAYHLDDAAGNHIASGITQHAHLPGRDVSQPLDAGVYYIRVEAKGVAAYIMEFAAAAANALATGAPTISGVAQVGETLLVDTSGIADADGLTNASYSYQWLSDDGSTVSEIASATGPSFAVSADDEGSTIQVKVSFTDDAGHDESLTSAATEPVSFAVQQQTVNSPATGQPSISGTAQVGETLTADISGISDQDGLTNVAYDYQWLADDADIAGATAETYTLVDADEGAAIKVRVSFTDDAGNEESLTSAATDMVEARPNSPATGQPTIAGTAQVGETLAADTSGISDSDGLSNVAYDYQWLADGADIAGANATTYTLVDADGGAAVKVRVSFTDDAGNEETLTSAATEPVGFAVQQQTANSPATGQPSISGTAQVGVTLTADTSGISDADGLSSAVYRFQWLADDADIAGATATTYTLVDADAGATIKVRVSFTDDAGNEEELTSAATGTVEARPNSPATGQPTISGTVQVGETLTADTSGISDVDGLSNAVYQYQWLADDTGIAGATAGTYTLVDADEGAAVKVWVSFTDDAGNGEELTSAATGTVEARPNSPATGQTTISGTVQVGETLTADTSGISDADGLSNAVYNYQWLADYADIAGATATTYTLVDADGGAAIKVRVSFTDDAGNQEELTSAATAMVESGQPAGSAPDAPRKPDGTAVFIGGVDLEWTDARGADAYEVQTWRGGQWTDLPGDGVEIAFYGAGAIISGLDPQSSLWFQVRAVNGYGVSDWSPMLLMNATSEFTLGRRARPANVTATGAPVIVGAAEVGQTLRADTTGIEDGNGLERVRFKYQWTSNDGGDVDIAGATHLTYVWSDDDEGRTVSVRVSFVDRLGYAESLSSAAVGTVAVQQQTANSPASGAPTISGTAQVGETLTADTSGISDQDGLTNVAYGYQWLADDADIAGATTTTYTLTDSEEGKTVQVKVSFTDDAGNEESLTSTATVAVAAAEPAEPPTMPTGLTAAASHDQVVLSWDDPQYDSITGYVILRRNRATTAPGEFTELVADTGSAANTYTDDSVAADTSYTYRIKAINRHGVSELSRWVRADTPAPPVPATPTGLTATASHEQVVLSWDDPQDDNITGYVILRRNRATTAPGEFTELVADTGSAANTYADDSVSADTSYTYRIKAINRHGVSELSRWVRADTPEAP